MKPSGAWDMAAVPQSSDDDFDSFSGLGSSSALDASSGMTKPRHANQRYDSLFERVMSKVEKAEGTNENGCWFYLGRLDKDGYGRLNVRIDGKHVTKRCHTIVWEEVNQRRVPPDLTLDHIDCIAKCCCHPDHVELVTRKVNSERSQAKNPRSPPRARKRHS